MDTRPTGRIVRDGGYFQARLQRDFDHPPAAAWAMLTESSAMAQWLAPGTIELRDGGAVRIDFADSGIVIDSRLTAFAPGRLLEYSWSSGDEPQRPLRWELQASADGCVLTLGVRVPVGEDAAKACAGFEAHLDMLAAALEGVAVRFPFDVYQQARKAYAEQVAALA